MRALAVREQAARRRAEYALDLARAPVAWTTLAVSVAASAAIGPPAALLLAGVAAVAGWVAAAHPGLQRRLDRARALDALRAWRDARETRLESAGVSRETLSMLTDLVDRIVAGKVAALPELEALLDRYVDHCLARHQLRIVIASTLLSGGHDGDDSLRAVLARRRRAHIDRCRERCTELDSELRAIERRLILMSARVADPTA